jgi:outer membrane protein assembly factor BamB
MRPLRRLGLIFLAAPLLALAARVPVPPGDPIEGKWYGTAGHPEDRVELGFEIKRNEKGELKAYHYIPVNNLYGVEISGVEKDGDTYVLPAYLTSFAFTGDRDHVEGMFMHYQRKGTFLDHGAPLALQRVAALPSEVPVPELPAGPGPKWRAQLGGGIYAPAAVHAGVAYVGTTSGVFNAVNLTDGSIAWAVPAGRGIFGEALVTAEAVYFTCDNGYLFKLARADGKEIWKYDLGGERVPRVLMHPTITDVQFWDHRSPKPALADGMIYVGSADGSFHALKADSGERVWRVETKARIRSDAVVDGRNVIFANFRGQVLALDRQSGAEVWKLETHAPVIASPALIGDRIVFANRAGFVAALQRESGAVLWRTVLWGSAADSTAVPFGDRFYLGASDLRRITCYDPADNRVVWRTDIFGITWGRPAVTEKVVFASAGGYAPYQMRHLGGLTALDRATGRILWRWTIPQNPDLYETGFAAGPTVAGDLVLVGSMNGVLYAFPASE